MVVHHRLAAPVASADDPGVCRDLLRSLRCIQVDPLDRIGTNADLVAMARIDGLRRGELFERLYARDPHCGAFEHFAKERCLLPPTAFPRYRAQAVETPWWRLAERMRRVPDDVVEAVYAEIEKHGPLGAHELADKGRVEPIDWHGWQSTSKLATMALRILWTQCRVVVCERTPQGKRYDIPSRALPESVTSGVSARSGESVYPIKTDDGVSFERWALLARVEACGLLSRAAGNRWSMLRDVQRGELPEQLVAEGELVSVTIAGSRRRYLARPEFLEAPVPTAEDFDDRMRILGPLDPLIWDRKLVKQVFDFEYVWEVYKPEHKRRWGYYVCPLLHRGRLVGRFEGRIDDEVMHVLGVWRESGGRHFDDRAFHAALEDHAARCGATDIVERAP